jgi:hypothetical protein
MATAMLFEIRNLLKVRPLLLYLSKAIEDKLQDGTNYTSTYDVEKALGLVVEK